MKFFILVLMVAVGSQLVLNVPEVLGQTDETTKEVVPSAAASTEVVSTAAASTAGVSTAAASTAGVSTAAASTAGVSTAAASTAGVSTAAASTEVVSTAAATTKSQETTSKEETTTSQEGTTKSHEGTTTSHEGTTTSHEGTTKSHEGTTTSHEGTTKSHEGTTKSEGTTSSSSAISSAGTSTVTPSPTPVPTTQNFSCEVNGTTRFSLTGSFALSITYTDKEKNPVTVSIAVPQTTETEVHCSGPESVKFHFFNDWNIEYIFGGVVPGLLAADASNYYISNITVRYVHDDHLPNSETPGALSVAAYTSSNYLESPADASYYCKSNISLAVDDKVTLTSVDFKYKAYNADGNIDFNSGTVNECSADDETNSIVPIAVGAALAGLVVIVLIAYLIGRRRSRKAGYDSV